MFVPKFHVLPQQRAEARDYIDVDALLEHGIALPLALAAARAIYGEMFNPQITLKALSYFDDGNLRALPDEMKQRIARAVVPPMPTRCFG